MVFAALLYKAQSIKDAVLQSLSDIHLFVSISELSSLKGTDLVQNLAHWHPLIGP